MIEYKDIQDMFKTPLRVSSKKELILLKIQEYLGVDACDINVSQVQYKEENAIRTDIYMVKVEDLVIYLKHNKSRYQLELIENYEVLNDILDIIDSRKGA